ncbi:MAG: TrmO family methyltransferase [Actinomycetota bacterium]|nr:TrmO family methyltransferase [Actinomycetota bacterium]
MTSRTPRSCSASTSRPRHAPPLPIRVATKWPLVGILSGRGPHRPNHLGVTVCRLVEIDGLRVTVRGLDAIAGVSDLQRQALLAGAPAAR